MAIGTSCYIREIPKEQFKLLEVLSLIFNEKTATGIYTKLPAAYFEQRETIASLKTQIEELKQVKIGLEQELKDIKGHVNQFITTEKELTKAKKKLKEFL